jgi:hypothetical protein
MATAQANAAAPLDQVLVDVGAGPLGRWLPGRPGVEFIASLAGHRQSAQQPQGRLPGGRREAGRRRAKVAGVRR